MTRKPGVELPVPVEGLVQPLPGRCGVQEQVVRRVAEDGQRAERALEGGAAGAERLVVELGEVRRMLARNDPQFERGAAGGRSQHDESFVGKDQAGAVRLLGLRAWRTRHSSGG